MADYVRAIGYAFSRPWRENRDQSLNQNVIASLFGFTCAVIAGFVVLVKGDELVNLLWGALFLAFGLAEAAYVVHRYRQRNEPERDPYDRIVRTVDDRIKRWRSKAD